MRCISGDIQDLIFGPAGDGFAQVVNWEWTSWLLQVDAPEANAPRSKKRVHASIFEVRRYDDRLKTSQDLFRSICSQGMVLSPIKSPCI